MKQRFYFFVLISFFILIPKILYPNTLMSDSISSYLILSFKNQSIANDSLQQSIIKSRIEDVIENEGIHLIHKERPERYKLNINVIVSDSIIIKADGIEVNEGIIAVRYPKQSYPYKNETDIYNSLKDYIKKNIKIESK